MTGCKALPLRDKRQLRPERWALRLRRSALVAAFAFTAMLSNGCVYRRMMVRSDPEGARVIVDGQEVGYTPVGVPFTYYGTREITLVKPGYETHTELVKIPAPWYQVFPLDFVSDNLLPFQVTDRQEVFRQLRPQGVVPTDQLYDRAESLRSESHFGK